MSESFNPRKLLTLLWILINVFMIGLGISAFMALRRIPVNMCPVSPPTLPPSTKAPTTPPPTLSNATGTPSLGNGTSDTPTMGPTSVPSVPSPTTFAPSFRPSFSPTTLAPSNAPRTMTPSAAPTKSPTNETDEGEWEDPEDSSKFYDDGNQGFVAMWASLLLLCTSILGSSVLKQRRTPFMLGTFLGVTLIMTNVMLMLSASSIGDARRRARFSVNNAAADAIAVFSVLETMLLAVFAGVLAKYNQEIQSDDDTFDPDAEIGAVSGASPIPHSHTATPARTAHSSESGSGATVAPEPTASAARGKMATV